jgi:serine/threonine-protein kinase
MSTSDNTPRPDAVIAGRYRLERPWAHGGMADVWKATDLQLSRTVAVKLLKAHLTADQTVAERFRREAVAAASLNHPNIVAVYDAVEDNGRQAVVMEFIDGKSLRTLLDERRTLTPKLTVHIGSGICAALDAAHAKGIIHRDVKPGNVLVTKDGRVMLTDFGIAKALGTGDDLTSENIMMGTAKYLSPEQVRGDELDLRADLYSLGLVLYECLAGKVPFVGKNDTETALARLQRDPTALETLRPDVAPPLAAAIHRMLERSPSRRYGSGAEARAALRAAQASDDSGDRPRDRRDERATDESRAAHPSADRTPTPGKVIRPSGHTPSNSSRPRTDDDRSSSRGSSRSNKISPVVWIGAAIAALAVVALIARLVGGSDAEVTLPAPAATTAPPEPPGPPRIAGVTAYDPEGDATENDGDVLWTTDGDRGTIWSTVCYKSETFGSKSGVGLIVQLNEPNLARIDVDITNTTWRADMYASNTLSDSVSGWGDPIASGSSDDGPTLIGVTSNPMQYVMIYLREVDRDPGCSDANPYRGNVSEISVSPAP